MTHEVISVRKVQDWIQLIHESGGVFERWLQSVYGGAPEFIREQKRWYQKILLAFANIYDVEVEVIIARAPARINLVGMHIDHRGGHVNPIAAKEMVIVAQPRDDDYILLHDIDSDQFLPRRFRISDELPKEKIEDWLQWTELQSEKIKRKGTAGDWANYVKASALYLQELHRDSSGEYTKRLRGMNALVAGNIPVAAGLGSSSALVVASAEALVRINQLNFTPDEFVTICGTAEWYVGTRGGFGDRAAIKFSQKGHISRIGFFPLQVDFAPFLDGYRVAICHTHKEAKKAAWAKSVFNERVATYEIGLMLLRQKYPAIRDNVQYFCDLIPPAPFNKGGGERPGIDEAELYEMLKSLPIRISREELKRLLEEETDTLCDLFRTHDEPKEGYRVRGVCLFGLAECARAELAASCLKNGDMVAFGELISLSHDGDRVTRLVNGKRVKCYAEVTDEYLDKMIADLRSNDKTRFESARLYRQPGGYAVSCEELDELVDIAMSVEGVLGAGRVGAGLGGCISVLVDKNKTDELIQKISEEYYHPRNLPAAIEVCFPVAGSGIIDV
jgi:N-acetylgalactosamine kinase